MQVRIVLDDDRPGEGNTWVTVVPVRTAYMNRTDDVVDAAMEAAGHFVKRILQDMHVVNGLD